MKLLPMIIRNTTFLFSVIMFLLLSFSAFAQENQKPMQLSGVVLEAAETNPVPNVTVKNISRNISALADSTGFFSLPAHPGDTLLFEAMLYQPDTYVVPKGIRGSRFAVIEVLQKDDAIVLQEVTVRAFPTQQQFEQALLEIDPGNVADKTIRLNMHMEEVTSDPTNMQQYIRDYNQRYAKRQMTYLIPEAMPGNNFLNPLRWGNFIRDWREGRFNEESIEELRRFPNPNEENMLLPAADE